MFWGAVCFTELFLETEDLAFDLTGAFFTFSTFVVFGADTFLTAVAFFAGLFFAGAFEAVGLALMPTDFLTGVEFFKGVFLAGADFGGGVAFFATAFFLAEAAGFAFLAGTFLAGALETAGLALAVLDLVAEDTFFFAVMRNRFRQNRNSTKVGKHIGTTRRYFSPGFDPNKFRHPTPATRTTNSGGMFRNNLNLLVCIHDRKRNRGYDE